jgi:uncharacterized repeat protein (TIGR02543 family)
MGYLDSTTTKVGKTIQIQSITRDAAYVQNIGDGDVELAEVYLDGVLLTEGTAYSINSEGTLLSPSETATITFLSPTGPLPNLKANVKVVTTEGLSVELTETFSGVSSGSGGGTYSIAVTVNPSSAAGSVSPDIPGPYDIGDVVTLTPIANPGYTFSGWSGDLTGNDNPATLTVTGNMAVTATFALDPVTLTRRAASLWSGSVSVPTSTANFGVAPQEGSLLVVIAGHRVQNNDVAPNPTITQPGWNLAGLEYFKTSGSTSDRRVLAVFYKEAGSSESTTVTINWGNADSSTGFAILQEFTPSRDTSYSIARVGGRSSGTSIVTSLSIPQTELTAPTEPYILSIAATAWRDDAPSMTGNTFTSGLSNTVMALGSTSAIRGFSAYTNTAVLQTTAAMSGSTDPDMMSGILVLFACS